MDNEDMDQTTIAALAEMQGMTNPSLLPSSSVKPKKRRTVPSSDAESRRKEANRLAAERSRGRQHEKFVALETAAQVLGEENLRLKDEISKLEHFSDMGGGGGEATVNNNNEVTVHDSSTFTSVDDDQVNSQDTSSAQAQQDSHSRTILAALMSGSGIQVDESFAQNMDNLESANENWIDGVERLLDPETSGRLGELAAIAAGRGQPEEGGSGGAAKWVSPGGAAQAATALHREMEQMLKEDLIAIRAATARVNEQIENLKSGLDEIFMDVNESALTRFDIPDTILSSKRSVLTSCKTDIESKVEEVTLQIGVLREVVIRMREAKAEEEEKLRLVVGEVQALGMDGGDKERERVGTVLRALKNYVGFLLGGPNYDSTLATSNFVAPFSSPATARRRRGRPPKTESQYYASDHHSDQDLTMGMGTTTQTRGQSHQRQSRRRNTRAKSKLDQVVNENDGVDFDADDHHHDHDHGGEGEGDAATEADHDFLSHLAAQHGSPRDLNSSSFTDFLPAAAAAESSSHSQGQSHIQSHPSTHQITNTRLETLDDVGMGLDVEEGDQQQEQEQHEIEENEMTIGIINESSSIPNVLSRLKKGPPGSCDICGRTETSVWRKLTLGSEDLKVCNPCGLYHSKFGVIRPPELWGDGKSVRKRKAPTRSGGVSISNTIPGLEHEHGHGHGHELDDDSENKNEMMIDDDGQEVEMLDDDHRDLVEGEGGEQFGEGEFEGLVNDLDKAKNKVAIIGEEDHLQGMGAFYV